MLKKWVLRALLISAATAPVMVISPRLATVDRAILQFMTKARRQDASTLIRVRPGSADAVARRLHASGLRPRPLPFSADLLAADLSADSIAVVRRDPDVLSLSLDAPVRGAATSLLAQDTLLGTEG